jgi:hypothetical protein
MKSKELGVRIQEAKGIQHRVFSRQLAASLSVIRYLLYGRSVATSSFNDLNDFNVI